MNTYRHHYLLAVAEQHSVLQHVIGNGAEDVLSSRYRSQVEVKESLQLIQRQHNVFLESLCHKVLQLRGQAVGGAPSVSMIQAGGGGAGVTINRTVVDGGRSVHQLLRNVAVGFLFDLDAASCTSAVQVPLQRRLVVLSSLLSKLQALRTADMNGLYKTHNVRFMSGRKPQTRLRLRYYSPG